MLLPGEKMENQKYDDKLIREVISNAPCSILSEMIEEYIHNSRYKDISRRKILDGEGYRTIALDHGLTIRRCKSIVRQSRRIIYDHL